MTIAPSRQHYADIFKKMQDYPHFVGLLDMYQRKRVNKNKKAERIIRTKNHTYNYILHSLIFWRSFVITTLEFLPL